MNGRTTNDLRSIVIAGGGLKMNTEGRTDEELRALALAAAASEAKPRLIFYNLAGRTTEALRHIAAAGRGCVLFSDET